MSGNPLFEKPEGISWNPASVDLPPLPSIQAGEDSMSATISAAIPALHAEMTASVSTLQAKEGMFSSKVLDAQSAYQNADDAGGQSVGQMGSQMGQIGQMAQQAAGAAGKAGESGGGGGVFSQLMEQAMKAVQGATGSGQSGEGAEAQGAQGQQPAGMAGTPPAQPAGGGGNPAHSGDGQKDGGPKASDQQAASERDEQKPTERAPLGQPPAATAGPGDRQHVAGPAPVSPAPSSRGADQDVTRNL
jgi:hypothetical protein